VRIVNSVTGENARTFAESGQRNSAGIRLPSRSVCALRPVPRALHQCGPSTRFALADSLAGTAKNKAESVVIAGRAPRFQALEIIGKHLIPSRLTV
jgi:hypothetical protein